MKKTLMVLMMVMMAAMLIVSCDNKTEEPEGLHVGGKGPAGGYIFYDCDADNDSTNDGAGPDGLKSSVCGWRFIEAASADLSAEYCFGFHKTFTGNVGTNLSVGATATAIGKGKENTEKLVETLGETAYKESGTAATEKGEYAAKKCADYAENGFDDWYLPSRDELEKMYTELYKKGIGNMKANEYYWSSSEVETNAAARAYRLNIEEDKFDESGRYFQHNVRPIRYVKAD